jgi:hypothetical protein
MACTTTSPEFSPTRMVTTGFGSRPIVDSRRAKPLWVEGSEGFSGRTGTWAGGP